MINLYTYYDPVPEIDSADSLRLILLWRERWAAEYFNPIVLNEWRARQHPYFSEYAAAIEKLPSVNPARYETACWYRWLALAEVGGGWMSDYDAMPSVGFAAWFALVATQHAPNKIHIFQTPCCPAFVYSSQETAEKFCRAVVEAGGSLGNRPQGEKPHYSDQYLLEDLHMRREDWIETHDVMKLWSDIGWETAPMLHFANAVLQPKKLLPRWQHIPGILAALK